MAVEKIVCSADGSQRRRPDISATWRGGLRVVFEAQLKTTFLDVVVRRRVFYRDQGALLVWILRSFDPFDRRLTVDDLLFKNNSNIFVDQLTIFSSKASGTERCRIWIGTTKHGMAPMIGQTQARSGAKRGVVAKLNGSVCFTPAYIAFYQQVGYLR